MPEPRHFTTRRGFIAALGFGAVSLYGAWAAVGAAPLPFSGGGAAAPHTPEQPAADAHGGHGGHGGAPAAEAAEGHGGHGAPGAMTPEEFRAGHERFLQSQTQTAAADPHAMTGHTMEGHAMEGHAMAESTMAEHGQHGGHDPAPAASGDPTDVYLLAQRFAYSPDVVFLKAGQPYRFRMMAEDVTHGASIHLGGASRIIRLRPGVVNEQTLTFTRPGEYLVYCTVYCGQAHDAMQGRIVVS